MKLNEIFVEEIRREVAITLRILNGLEDNIFDYQLHEKSMSAGNLAQHLASIMSWAPEVLNAKEIDWETYQSDLPEIKNKAQLVESYEKFSTKLIEAVSNIEDNDLEEEWTMRRGEAVFLTAPKHVALRGLILNHTVHHRAQLGVNLRLNNLSVPATYFSSADTK